MILVNVKSYDALLLMLLVCINIYQKSVLRYKFVTLDTCHLDSIFVWARMKRSVVIFGNQKGFGTKSLGNTDLSC